jgi:hypothetical protein
MQSRPSLEWQDRARGLLRAELARRNVTQKELVERLNEMGISETEKTVSNKLIRGAFSTVFLLQCCDAIGCRVLRLSEDD